jgi:LuxR family maltose regulon positive regulatory protein
LKRAETAALQLKKVSQESGLTYADSWSDWMQACCFFHAYDLDKARKHFSAALEHKYIMHTSQAVNCLAGLALTCQAAGREDEATTVTDEMMEFALETKDPNGLVIARSAKARLSTIRGNLEPGAEWMQSFDEPFHHSSLFVWLELPHATRCRVLLAMGSEDSVIEACERLEPLLEEAASRYNTCHVIDLLVLKGLALYKLSRVRESLRVMEEAIKLAIPGGWVRPFVEPGNEMTDLLKQLQESGIAVDHIEKLLAVFRNDGQEAASKAAAHPVPSPPHHPGTSSLSQPLVEPLTNRELDVLELLSRRLQDKEIAKKLFISPTTVKTHLKHIYQKFSVRSRLQAIEKARKLGFL